MRFHVGPKKNFPYTPSVGSTRSIRKFALLPTKTGPDPLGGYTWVWLEHYVIIQQYVRVGWLQEHRWINIKCEVQ